MPIIKAWPGGAANAYQTLMTQNRSPAELALEAGCSEEIIKEIEEGVVAEIESMRLYPEVLAVLNSLRQSGAKWAVVSNLAQPYAKPLLDLLPYKPDAWAWSFAVGYRKPEEGIYRHACDELNVEPSSVLMIGDSMENDYQAPKRFGMRARYLNRMRLDENMPERIFNLTGILKDI